MSGLQNEYTCASCGEMKELCGSCRIDDIQQPRVCKDCLIRSMGAGDFSINDAFWIRQLVEAKDLKSLEALKKQMGVKP